MSGEICWLFGLDYLLWKLNLMYWYSPLNLSKLNKCCVRTSVSQWSRSFSLDDVVLDVILVEVVPIDNHVLLVFQSEQGGEENRWAMDRVTRCTSLKELILWLITGAVRWRATMMIGCYYEHWLFSLDTFAYDGEQRCSWICKWVSPVVAVVVVVEVGKTVFVVGSARSFLFIRRDPMAEKDVRRAIARTMPAIDVRSAITMPTPARIIQVRRDSWNLFEWIHWMNYTKETVDQTIRSSA